MNKLWMDPLEYLNRIGYHGPTECTLKTLRGLAAAHLKTVPFDNLDLTNRKSLEITELFHRIVRLGRGGICMELNGLFAWLLSRLEFDVDLIRGDTIQEQDKLCERDNHPTILVHLDGEEWIVDVGNNGYLYLEPLRLEVNVPQDVINGTFIITKDEKLFTLKRKRKRQIMDEGEIRERSSAVLEPWKSMYCFYTKAEVLSDFEEAFQFQKTCPSTFNVRNSICSLITQKGMTMLWGKTLIRKEYVDLKTEKIVEKSYISDDEKLREILRNVFGITLTANVTFLSLDFEY